MLLTSSAVSVAISSFVVFMFTGALFLSGYVLQQQTVRDLRAAIQPKEIPQAARLHLPPQFVTQPTPSPKANDVTDLQMVEIEIAITRDRSKSVQVEEDDRLDDRPGEVGLQKAIRPSQDTTFDQRPIMAEDLASSQLDSSDEIFAGSNTDDLPKEKPMSKAQRRKKIKEEILAAGEGEGFKGYKRRQY